MAAPLTMRERRGGEKSTRKRAFLNGIIAKGVVKHPLPHCRIACVFSLGYTGSRGNKYNKTWCGKMKKMLFRRLWAGLAALAACMAAGCTVRSAENNRVEANGLGAAYKSSPWLPFGRKAAAHGGRIYYLSGETGVQGIHSMADDGSDVRLEAAVRDIRKLQIADGKIYFAGFRDFQSNANGAYANYTLSAAGAGAPAGEIYAAPGRQSLWDFYVDGENNLWISAIGWKTAQNTPGTILSIIPSRNTEAAIIRKHSDPPIGQGDGFAIAKIGDLLVSAEVTLAQTAFDGGENAEIAQVCYSLFAPGGGAVMGADYIDGGSYKYRNTPVIWRQGEAGGVISQGNRIYCTTGGMDRLINSIELPGERGVTQYIQGEEGAYAVARGEDKAASLWFIGAGNGAEKVYSCGAEEQILFVDSGKMILKAGNELVTMALGGAGAAVSGRRGLPELTGGFSADAAGSWLFGYAFDETDNVNKLAFKYNMDTGEIWG